MSDTVTPEKRSAIMAAVKGRGNRSTEERLASLLRRHRLSGWRRHWPLEGRPDFVFRKERVAIFVDGCFWHGCPAHLRVPKTNRKFWAEKIERNRARDKKTTAALRRSGWRVVRVWEHELRDENRVARKLTRILNAARTENPR